MKLVEIVKRILVESTSDIKSDVEKYLDKIRAKTHQEWTQNGYNFPEPVYTASYGPSWIRIETTTNGGKGQKSVHCFIDKQGNIYKAASWKAPAKGIRGTIYDATPPLTGYDFYRR